MRLAPALIAGLTVLVFAGCGEARETVPSSGMATTTAVTGTSEEPRSGLTFRRTDGSEIEMKGEPLVWCGPWNDELPDTALQVAALGGLPRRAGQGWFSYWQLWAIPDDVREGTPFRFPGDYSFDDPSGVVLFVGDSETENEASTEGEDSSGRIVFSHASCDLGAPVEFTIDAVIDSEFFDGQPVKVQGTFSGVVREPRLVGTASAPRS